MHDRHLSFELLDSIHRGERSPSDLTTVAMAHLFETCSKCRDTLEAWRQELGADSADLFLTKYDSAFDRLRARIRGNDKEDAPVGAPAAAPGKERLEDHEGRARELMDELLARPRAEQLRAVEEQRHRYSGVELAHSLLEESRSNLPARPSECLKLARLARAVVQHCEITPQTTELYSRALAHQGNALRTQGELRIANEFIEVARFLLKSQGGGDRMTRAELDSFEGSLRRAQQHLDEAATLFSRAIMAYAVAGRKSDAANNLLALGTVLRERGDDDRAIAATRQALEIATDEVLPSLALYARHNLAYFLLKAGENEEARRVFEESQSLYDEQQDTATQLRRLWLRGHLERSEGKLREAEDCYRAVQAGFSRLGSGYYSALAALDLATLFAEQARTAEIKQLAEELVPLFEAQDLHRETAAALMLFQDAVRAEQVTLRYLLELIRFLERARLNPTLQFRAPA